MKTKSGITGIKYNPEECVYILNPLQVYKYLDNGAELLDVICGNEKKLVFVFNREDTCALYDKWCKREL